MQQIKPESQVAQKIDNFNLVVKNEDHGIMDLEKQIENDIKKQEVEKEMAFKINSFFTPQYSTLVQKLGGFHLDFTNIHLSQQKLQQIQQHLKSNRVITDLRLVLIGCGIKEFKLN